MNDRSPLARILIVEDESIVALDIASQLRDIGYDVVGIADNAEDALRLAVQRRPDLTLVDVRLKGTIDGVQIADQLRREHDVPVLYLSSHSDAETVRRAAQTRPYGYLTKPFDLPELRAGIEVALHKAAMERRLRASEQRFRSAFDAAPLGMALLSLQGRLLKANEAMCRMLGTDARSVVGLRIVEFALPISPVQQQALDGLIQGEAAMVQFETACRRCDSSATVPVLVSVSLVQELDDRPCWLVHVLDLTAQKEAEDRLKALAAQKVQLEAAAMASRARNEFLSRMSHELRTPLNAVIGFAQLLTVHGGADPTTAEYAQHISQAGQHLLSLVDDVLDLQGAAAARATPGTRLIPLDALVADTLRLLQPLADRHRVSFVRAIDPALRVVADDVRLRQVLVNIGSNAVKYNRPGGAVTWRADTDAKGGVRLFVEDTGCGMTPASLAHLFEPFNRLGMEYSGIPGTGLGLLIARTLMEAQGGRLNVDSQPGVGTSVCLAFAT